ncbi:MAG: DUF3429 family protein [Proteobacteria bacterium]|jgi:hypothetical protein|nr:DUF3429 family protein [Candidatus Fonsibacter sp. PEL5]NKA16449.1 DUF3429 family protein [Candidatus Fonsibacter sp. PEL55]
MPIEKKKLATILGHLGLIPFFALTIIFFISNFNNYVVDVYLFYANIILSFLCGSQWSKILNSNISSNKNLLLTLSVLVPVFSFILDFFANQDIKIAIYMVLFFATNFIDGKIFSESNNVWYLNLRKRLTFLVILTLVINLFAVNAYRFL